MLPKTIHTQSQGKLIHLTKSFGLAKFYTHTHTHTHTNTHTHESPSSFQPNSFANSTLGISVLLRPASCDIEIQIFCRVKLISWAVSLFTQFDPGCVCVFVCVCVCVCVWERQKEKERVPTCEQKNLVLKCWKCLSFVIFKCVCTTFSFWSNRLLLWFSPNRLAALTYSLSLSASQHFSFFCSSSATIKQCRPTWL